MVGNYNNHLAPLKHRLDIAMGAWALERLDPNALASGFSGRLLFALAQHNQTNEENTQESLEITASDTDLSLIRNHVSRLVEQYHSDAMSTPESVAERKLYDAMLPLTDLLELAGAAPIHPEDQAALEAEEFHEMLRGIALGRYMLSRIDIYLADAGAT